MEVINDIDDLTNSNTTFFLTEEGEKLAEKLSSEK